MVGVVVGRNHGGGGAEGSDFSRSESFLLLLHTIRVFFVSSLSIFAACGQLAKVPYEFANVEKASILSHRPLPPAPPHCPQFTDQQATTMTLLADILDRAARVAGASALAGGGARDLINLVRQRMPEVQTLLGLRDRLGDSAAAGASVAGTVDSPGSSTTAAAAVDNRSAKRKKLKGKLSSTLGGGGEGGANAASAGGAGLGVTENKSVFLRWRLLSLLDRYAQVIPAAVSAARFDFLKLLPAAASIRGGRGGWQGESACTNFGTGFQTMHPLVQLAMLRLLARPGVVVSTTLASASATGRSGWLAERTAASEGDGSVDKSGQGENTPLGVVLRMALDAPTPAIREAARMLAVRALQSLGVVTETAARPPLPPTPPPDKQAQMRWSSDVQGLGRSADRSEGSGGGGSGCRKGDFEGEADLWLDLVSLHPRAIGPLVLLARDACRDAQGLLATGIRAGEKGMRQCSFLGLGNGEGGGGGDGASERIERDEGDWEVEFR